MDITNSGSDLTSTTAKPGAFDSILSGVDKIAGLAGKTAEVVNAFKKNGAAQTGEVQRILADQEKAKQESGGLSKTAWIVIGVIGVALLGIGAWLIGRKG